MTTTCILIHSMPIVLHILVIMKNILLFRITLFSHLACKSRLPLLLLPIYIVFNQKTSFTALI